MSYVDYTQPLVQKTAQTIAGGKSSDKEIVEALFYYVRDNIKYQLLPKGDFVAASSIIKQQAGQCNNKTILFLALCQAKKIPARIHFGLIDKKIIKGLIADFIFEQTPQGLSHSWQEVQIDNQWKRIDTHILDSEYYTGAMKLIQEKNLDMGYSIVKESIKDFVLYDQLNPDHAVILDDHGTYTDPAEYFKSDKYTSKPNFITKVLYGMFMKQVNKKIKQVRAYGSR